MGEGRGGKQAARGLGCLFGWFASWAEGERKGGAGPRGREGASQGESSAGFFSFSSLFSFSNPFSNRILKANKYKPKVINTK